MQGDITEKVTDVHFDYGRNKVTMQIQRLIELPDGSLWSLDARTEEKDYQDQASMEAKPVAQVKLDITSKKVDVIKMESDGILR